MTLLLLLVVSLLATPALRAELAPAAVESAVAAACRQADISLRRVSWLLTDRHHDTVIASSWSDVAQPIPVGSLVKPFAALAYAQGHDYRYPVHECRGKQTRCWFSTGHGRIGIVEALAHSCNSYFRQLTREILPVQIEALAARFGLPAPPPEAPAKAYFGLGSDWRIAPLDLVRAYHELLRRSAQPAVGPILAGLHEAARGGTAAGLGEHASFAKTGTAPCTHTGLAPAADGDGFVILLAPPDQERATLMVRVHGVPGMVAAELGGRVWQAYAAIDRDQQ